MTTGGSSSRWAPVAGSWADVMGVRFVSVRPEEIIAELTIEPRHLQAFGLVHGGVYAGLIETVASMGAAVALGKAGASFVGIENQTSFIGSTHEGRLRACATPIHVGRSTQLWSAAVYNLLPGTDDRLVATGRVRLLSTAKPGGRPA